MKKDAKKREKLEKFQQKKEMEAKKKTQPPSEVELLNLLNLNPKMNLLVVLKHLPDVLVCVCIL